MKTSPKSNGRWLRNSFVLFIGSLALKLFDKNMHSYFKGSEYVKYQRVYRVCSSSYRSDKQITSRDHGPSDELCGSLTWRVYNLAVCSFVYVCCLRHLSTTHQSIARGVKRSCTKLYRRISLGWIASRKMVSLLSCYKLCRCYIVNHLLFDQCYILLRFEWSHSDCLPFILVCSQINSLFPKPILFSQFIQVTVTVVDTYSFQLIVFNFENRHDWLKSADCGEHWATSMGECSVDAWKANFPTISLSDFQTISLNNSPTIYLSDSTIFPMTRWHTCCTFCPHNRSSKCAIYRADSTKYVICRLSFKIYSFEWKWKEVFVWVWAAKGHNRYRIFSWRHHYNFSAATSFSLLKWKPQQRWEIQAITTYSKNKMIKAKFPWIAADQKMQQNIAEEDNHGRRGVQLPCRDILDGGVD